MKVLKGPNFDIYVYKDHAPPHCHVRFRNGKEVVVKLFTLEPLYGEKVSKAIKKCITDNLDFLFNKWDELN